MPRSLEIRPFDGKFNASIQPPGSKSITNRALVCAAFAIGRVSNLINVLDSDDSKVMIESLQRLGCVIDKQSPSRVAVWGLDGSAAFAERLHNPASAETIELFVGNSGTTIRFLTAALAIAGGNYRLSGVPRMHQRPIGDLVRALNQLGANVKSASPHDCPPVTINNERCRGGITTVRGNISSQYLSGLMMAAPLAEGTVEIHVEGELVSRPYVEMTAAVMQAFGVACHVNADFNRFAIEAGQQYRVCDYTIEPDASAASYFWGAAAICGGTVKVTGLNRHSIQGDVQFAACLARMGCGVLFADDGISVTGPATRAVELVMSDISDTVQTMAAVALFLPATTIIRGVAHNRVKETDRIGNLATELRKLGAVVDELPDGLAIHPGPLRAAQIETYDDHRMAMSLSLVGLRQPGVIILEPECVSKTYPNFYEDLEKICRPTG
jgi:3-phosphoshikimate 1-carboxyvinyltransferase